MWTLCESILSDITFQLSLFETLTLHTIVYSLLCPITVLFMILADVGVNANRIHTTFMQYTFTALRGMHTLSRYAHDGSKVRAHSRLPIRYEFFRLFQVEFYPRGEKTRKNKLENDEIWRRRARLYPFPVLASLLCPIWLLGDILVCSDYYKTFWRSYSALLWGMWRNSGFWFLAIFPFNFRKNPTFSGNFIKFGMGKLNFGANAGKEIFIKLVNRNLLSFFNFQFLPTTRFFRFPVFEIYFRYILDCHIRLISSYLFFNLFRRSNWRI